MALALYGQWVVDGPDYVNWAERQDGTRVKIVVRRKHLEDRLGFNQQGDAPALRFIVAHQAAIIRTAENLDQPVFTEIDLS